MMRILTAYKKKTINETTYEYGRLDQMTTFCVSSCKEE